jgi:hypothetical protein
MSETTKENLSRSEQKHSLGPNPILPGNMVLVRDGKPLLCKQKPDPFYVPTGIGNEMKVATAYCGNHCPLCILHQSLNSEKEVVGSFADILCGCRPIQFSISAETKKEVPVMSLHK